MAVTGSLPNSAVVKELKGKANANHANNFIGQPFNL